MAKTTEGPTKAAETKEISLEKAYVLSAETGDSILEFFGELPYKYKLKIEPLAQQLATAIRTDVKVKASENEK